MKYGLLLFIVLSLQGVIFANDGGVATDIVPRAINFIIFAAIIYYILADKLKAFFSDRTVSIQSELEKVQQILNESKSKFESAKAELENSKLLASQIVADAKQDTLKIEQNIQKSVLDEVASLAKHFDEKIEVETKKAKKEVITEVLDVLLQGDNLGVSDDEMSKIILKKVA